jgi:hypothetical protein
MTYPEHVTSCTSVEVHRRFGRKYLPHLQSRKIKKQTIIKEQTENSNISDWCFIFAVCLVYSSALKMEVLYFSETSTDFSRSIWRHIPGDRTLHKHSCEKLKSNKEYPKNFPFPRVFAEILYLTVCSATFVEKPTFKQVVKKLSTFSGTRSYIVLFTRTAHWSVSGASWTHSKHSYSIFLRYCDVYNHC